MERYITSCNLNGRLKNELKGKRRIIFIRNFKLLRMLQILRGDKSKGFDENSMFNLSVKK